MTDKQNNDELTNGLFRVINKLILVIVVLVIAIASMPFILFYKPGIKKTAAPENTIVAKKETDKKKADNFWVAPAIESISDSKQKELVNYGKELIVHTSGYFGPNGSISHTTNGLNCQNCHLDAGTKIWGNNYGSVASLYPKFRARSGTVESIYKRVNDCFERSLNGKKLDSTGREMQAITAYINFLGTNVEKGKKAEGSGFKDLAYLDRAADPINGKTVYTTKCQSCHQPEGTGLLNTEKTEFTYPALWGKNSFNDGAGLYRISSLAKYVKYNMPQGTTFENPQLTDEEAWDVAAFVISQSRPHISEPKDWPDISKKPVDHPFGPYSDSFSEKQHKYGPFKPIVSMHEMKSVNEKTKVKS